MFSEMLDVALGLIILFTVLSITVSAVNELISSYMHRRSKNLFSFLESLLQDTNLGPNDVFHETVLTPQTVNGQHAPAYIKAADFSVAILDLLNRYPADTSDSTVTVQAAPPQNEGQPIDADRWKAMAAQLPTSSPLRQVMMTTIAQAEDDVKKAQTLLENWYDSSMEHVSAFYKTQTQLFVLAISILLVLLMNIDTITIANTLLAKPGIEAGLTSQAVLESQILPTTIPNTFVPTVIPAAAATDTVGQVTAPPEIPNLQTQSVSTIYNSLIDDLKLPIGWPDKIAPTNNDIVTMLLYLLRKIVGFGVTIFAISQGAPFWFDLLNKLTNLRYGGKPPDTSPSAQSAGSSDQTLALITQLQGYYASISQANANNNPSLPAPPVTTPAPALPSLPTPGGIIPHDPVPGAPTPTLPTTDTSAPPIPHDPMPDASQPTLATAPDASQPTLPMPSYLSQPSLPTPPDDAGTAPQTPPTDDGTPLTTPMDSNAPTTATTPPDSASTPPIAPPADTSTLPADTNTTTTAAVPPKPATLPGESTVTPPTDASAADAGALPLDPLPPPDEAQNQPHPEDQSPNG